MLLKEKFKVSVSYQEESPDVGQKEHKNLGAKVIKTLLSKILPLPIPIFVYIVPFLVYMSIKIQPFYYDIMFKFSTVNKKKISYSNL